MPEYLIIANGKRWSGWKTISHIRSMEKGASEFEVSLTSNYARDAQRALRDGEAIQIYLDNELLLTGYIDTLAPEYDANSIELFVTGRSKIADLIDCSTEGKQFKKQSYLNVAKNLCAPFGIDVMVAEGVNANQVLRQPAIDEGQSIFAFLEREARALALRLMDTPEGNLLITNTGTQTADALVLGENIREASGEFSQLERYQEYTVIGSQSRDNPLLSASNMTLNRGKARDDSITRHRPLVIVADDDLNTAACQKRAQWQRNTHYGRGRKVVYTVNTWQQKNNKSWKPNTLSLIEDEVVGLNETQLITEVRMTLDAEGPRTEIMVMPPEAMALTKLPPVKKESLF